MNSENRYSVTASLFMLREIKNREQKVKKAYQLLKKKAEALRIKGRQAALDLSKTQALLGHTLREAYISLAAIKFTNGESNALVLENIGQAQIRVHRVPDNISGVSTVLLQPVEVPYVGDVMKYAGLAAGGHRTVEAKKAFRETLIILLKFASLRNTCLILNSALQSTQRKLNGIEKVIMPKLRNTEVYITKEIDEREREEFHRLKMVKAKKNTERILSKVRTRGKSACYSMRDDVSYTSKESTKYLDCYCEARFEPASSAETDSNGFQPFCFSPHWEDED